MPCDSSKCSVERERPVSLIVSAHGVRLLETEMGISSVDALRDRIGAARLEGSGAGVR